MNFRYRLFTGVSFLLVLTVFFLFDASVETVPHTVSGLPMGVGTPDNPDARMHYEMMRLVDPETGELPPNIRARVLAFSKSLPVKNEAKSLSWIPIGPGNKGGRTRGFALDVLDENVMLAGGVTGGIWRSTDAGSSWVKTTDIGESHSATCIAQDTRAGKEATWYYGTGEYYGIVSPATSFPSRYSGDGIYRSTNNGLSWSKLASTSSGTPETMYHGADFDFVWNIVTDHTDLVNDVVLAAVYNGIWRSENGGETWSAVLGLDSTSSTHSHFVSLEKTSTGVFYAALSGGSGARGIYRSTDGISWIKIRHLTHNDRRTAIGVSPSDEHTVYFITESPGTGITGHRFLKYNYVSGDGSGSGGFWEDRSAQLPNTHCTGYFDFDFGPFNSQFSYDLCIAVHPTQPHIVFIGGTNIYRSTDGFATTANTLWIGGYQCDTIDPSNYVTPNHHPDQHLMVFSPSDPNLMYSMSDGGIAKTNDALAPSVTWESLNHGYYTTQFYTVAMEQGNTDNDIVIGGMQDNGTWFTHSLNANTPWKEVGIDDGAYCAIAQGREYYVISSQLGRMYKKSVDDNGNILATNRMDPSGGANSYNFINPFILDPNDNERLYLAARNKLWRNDSMSAIALNNDLYQTISTGWSVIPGSQISIQAGVISALEISPALPDVVYYGTSNGRLYRLDHAHTSDATQTVLTSTTFPSNAYISAVASNPHNGDELMVTFSNYSVRSVFHSADGGATFGNISGNLEENADGSGAGPAVYWASIYPTFPAPTYLAGTSVGLFSTTNPDGENTVWVQEGASTLGNVVINMIRTRTYDGKIIVGTHGNGVYASFFNPAVVGTEEPLVSAVACQAWPNPFKESLTLEYLLEKEAEVSIRIFDVQGKQVASPFTGMQQAGKQQVHWNGRNSNGQHLAAGQYIYRLQAGNSKRSGRISKVP